MHLCRRCRAGGYMEPHRRVDGRTATLCHFPSTMKPTHVLRASALLIATAICAVSAIADTVETKNGSRLVGSVKKIESGNVYLKTEYAGDLVIKQTDVVSIATDGEISVRLQSGTVLQGAVSAE